MQHSVELSSWSVGIHKTNDHTVLLILAKPDSENFDKTNPDEMLVKSAYFCFVLWHFYK